MSTNKLIFIRVKLDLLQTKISSLHSPPYTAAPAFVIKTSVGEVSFFECAKYLYYLRED